MKEDVCRIGVVIVTVLGIILCIKMYSINYIKQS